MSSEIRLDKVFHKSLEDMYNKSIDEIMAVARNNFQKVGFSEESIKFLLGFSETIINGYENEIPDYVKKHLDNGQQKLAIIDMFED